MMEMQESKGEKVREVRALAGDGRLDEGEKWVHDSSIDHKGRVPLRASTGAWRASLFIIAIEFSERLSYFGLATSLIIYLTRVIHQDLKTAAKNVNYWSAVTLLMPLLGGFLADSYLGRYHTVYASAVIYITGLILLTMSRFVPSLKPSSNIHEVVFFLAIYMISIGTGGHKPALESFGADQFDDDHAGERKSKMSFFNWWNFGLCSGLLLGVTVIVYVQDRVSWGAADAILAAVMAMSLLVFVAGRPSYRYRVPSGSPLMPMARVLVAALIKRNLPSPSDPSELYERPDKSPEKARGRLLYHTEKLKFLDKAAIVQDRMKQAGPWRLATVTEVEEVKLILNMIPIWMVTLPFGICVAQGTTFFIKQGTTLDRHILGGHFIIPPASTFALAAVAMIISVTLYEKLLVPVLRRDTGNERGMNILQRIGIGMVFTALSMAAAALVERRRLGVVNRHGPLEGSASMSVLWLAPQFVVMGIGDGFTLVGLQEYFYDQVPDSMRSLGIAFYLSVIGAGNFLSSLLITAVDRMSRDRTGRSWFNKDLNSSRLDNFYWVLTVMAAVNLCVYVVLAKRYPYKSVQRRSSGRTVAVAGLSEENSGQGV
ncbi:hypothetical protein SAY87_026951 [Trapa incisa]|uniref:NPF family transporter n=1 Tax=Trapa incisa TaxID=236973 RepID=A0AAN7H4B1_9MYRT|nr:hypothetical protein SAY87_026951 [Trapa incisa]